VIVRGLRVVRTRTIIGATIVGTAFAAAFWILLLSFAWHSHEAPPPPHQYGKTEYADPKAKIDPKTGNGTPWTIVWDKRGNYDYTGKDGKRKYEGIPASDRATSFTITSAGRAYYSSYGEAEMAMLNEQRDQAGRWSAAPLPTAQPIVRNTPTSSPTPGQLANLNSGNVSLSFSSGTGSFAVTTPTPKPAPTPMRLYARDQAENWMTVFQLDPNADKSWAHDNVKIETRAKPFVKPNKLTGGWTIEFVEKPAPR
jgi:hypothetical protein